MARMIIKVDGVKDMSRKFKAFGKEGERKFADITKIQAKEIEGQAKVLAPVDMGKLQQSISAVQVGKLTWKIQALIEYAPFVEFGTGDLTQIPKGWEEIARQFWTRKQWTGMRAQPYLYPAFKRGAEYYIKDLQNALKKLTRKYD